MLDRYTEKGRRALFVARFEASRFGSPKIETEHLLLGLVREDAEVVNRFLTSEISDANIRNQVLALNPTRESITSSEDIPLSDECKSILSLAAEEADALGQQQIGTEHLLLGLMRRQDCLAARMLRDRGANIEAIRRELAIVPQPVSRESRRGRLSKEIARLALEQIQMAEEPWENPTPASLSGFPKPEEVFNALNRFKGYTEKGRRSIFFAMYEANQFHSALIETEHLLLGIQREGIPRIDLFMPSFVSKEAFRTRIAENTVVREKDSVTPGLLFSKECERVLANAEEEATLLGSEQIGPEHLLVGLLREEGSFAAQLLREHGAEIERIRRGLASRPPQPPPNPEDPFLPPSS